MVERDPSLHYKRLSSILYKPRFCLRHSKLCNFLWLGHLWAFAIPTPPMITTIIAQCRCLGFGNFIIFDDLINSRTLEWWFWLLFGIKCLPCWAHAKANHNEPSIILLNGHFYKWNKKQWPLRLNLIQLLPKHKLNNHYGGNFN